MAYGTRLGVCHCKPGVLNNDTLGHVNSAGFVSFVGSPSFIWRLEFIGIIEIKNAEKALNFIKVTANSNLRESATVITSDSACMVVAS
jgi:hypothetical protein